MKNAAFEARWKVSGIAAALVLAAGCSTGEPATTPAATAPQNSATAKSSTAKFVGNEQLRGASMLVNEAQVEARLKALSDDELIAAYEAPKSVAREGDFKSADEEHGFHAGSPTYLMFGPIRAEIARRGGRLQPQLVAALRREIERHRSAPGGAFAGGATAYTKDAMDLLAQMREPEAAVSSAQALISIFEVSRAPDKVTDAYSSEAKRIDEVLRKDALYALGQLTLCAFFRCDPNSGRDRDMIERVGATTPRGPAPTGYSPFSGDEFQRAAAWYRAWLDGEGRDPAQWLSLARGRAHRFVAGDDLRAIYCAVEFLQAPLQDPPLTQSAWRQFKWQRRDDAPAQTAARLGEIIGQFKRGTVGSTYKSLFFYAYTYRGQKVPESPGNWTRLLAAYGSDARPYAKALIRLQEQDGLKGWSLFDDLSNIGGKEVVAYFITWLPRLDNKLKALGIADNPYRYAALDFQKMPSDPRQRLVLLADRWCRYTIDRWAGRTFKSNAERQIWWNANKDKTPEQWLRANLEATATLADSGDALAQNLARAALPDLPRDESEVPLAITSQYMDGPPRPAPPAPFRRKWLQAHWPQLRYDAALHRFTLPGSTAVSWPVVD